VWLDTESIQSGETKSGPWLGRVLTRRGVSRLTVLLAAGAIGVFGTLALLPKQLAVATPAAASKLGSKIDTARKASVPPSSVPAPTSTTVPAPEAAKPSAPTPAPTGTIPQATSQAPAPAQPSQVRGILPPAEPQNIAPQPNFLNSCSGSQYDDSNSCVQATLAAIANGRQAEGLPAMVLPSDWASLTPAEQLFVATNLERTVRGLPALSAMVSPLDAAATAGAASNVDPSPPGGFGFVQWGSNWAGAVGNPLEGIYYWMYDDGLGSSNIDCTPGNTSGCWGHRDNVLMQFSGSDLVMGVGYVANAYQGAPSWTELLVQATSSSPIDFSWQG